MGRSQKWPDLRSPISKIQDIRFVGTDDLIIFRKFHNFPWNIVAVARWESYFVVGSLDLTWWPDLTWPWAEIFTKVAEKMGGKVGENPAALRAAVFSLSSKNPRGGGRSNAPPPSRARVKCSLLVFVFLPLSIHNYFFPFTYVFTKISQFRYLVRHSHTACYLVLVPVAIWRLTNLEQLQHFLAGYSIWPLYSVKMNVVANYTLCVKQTAWSNDHAYHVEEADGTYPLGI